MNLLKKYLFCLICEKKLLNYDVFYGINLISKSITNFIINQTEVFICNMEVTNFKEMRKILFIMFTVLAMVNVNAERFTGVDANGQTVRYSGTVTVIAKNVCCGNIEISYRNEYRSFPPDTMNEVVKESEFYFVKYLEVGDKLDFCLTPDFDYMVRRVRFLGKENACFDENVAGCGESVVLRIYEDGTLCLENGVIIIKPRYEYNLGDTVCFRTSIQEFPLGRDLKRRAH